MSGLRKITDSLPSQRFFLFYYFITSAKLKILILYIEIILFLNLLGLFIFNNRFFVDSVKLADFGLSNSWSPSNLLYTFCGSPLYASPEIVNGVPYFGPEVDCWSLGVLLYTLVYGSMPFQGGDYNRLVQQISEGQFIVPRERSGKF